MAGLMPAKSILNMVTVVFARVRDDVREDMRLGGIEALVGAANFYDRVTDARRPGCQADAALGRLAAELKAREAQEDASTPAIYNGYVYEHRFSQGAQYPYIVRHKDVPGAQEEIVLDVGALATAHPQQCRLGCWTVSSDNKRVAFAVDFTGDREFRIFVRSIATGETVDQGIDDASSDVVFVGDSDALLYVRNEPTTLRSYQVRLHRLGTDPNSDVLIYEESDPTFSISIGLSKSRKLALFNINKERSADRRVEGH
jgi:oligopeptidase B